MVAGLLSSSGSQHAWQRRTRLGSESDRRERGMSDCLLRFCFKRGSANFFITILAVCALIYVAVYLFTASEVIMDETYGRAAIEAGEAQFREHEIERACSSVSGICYRVVDSVVPGMPPTVVRRELFTEGAGDDDSETCVMLKPPREDDTFNESDTRFWSVSHSRIVSAYVSALAVAPFVLGPIPLIEQEPNQRPPYQVLSIGLGGGNLDMFWMQLKKNMNVTVVEKDDTVVDLAHAWFGVKEMSRRDDEKGGDERRTVIADGIDFIMRESKRPVQYDVIAIDACDLDKDRPCPASSFLKRDVISAIDTILSPNGVVVVNVLPLAETPNTLVDEVVTTLLTAFNSCARLTVQNELNVVVSCTKKVTSGSKDYAKFLRMRMSTAMKTLGLDDIITGVVTGKRR